MKLFKRSVRDKKAGTNIGVSACSHARLTINALSIVLILSFGSHVYALPIGGAAAAGKAGIYSAAGNMTISQSTQNAVLNWQSFNIGLSEAVQFVQPNSNSIMLNRVIGPAPSSILGNLSSNGKVFLVNPNGILFGKSAQVNTGGLLASTLNISDSDFMAASYKFSGTGNGTILNQGTIRTNADGGYIALLGANVSNSGVITARLGSVALVAGTALTLDMAGDGLLNVMVNQGTMNALVHNGGLIQADGGQILLTTQAAGRLLQSVVNNSGVIQAQTIDNRNGTIKLLADMQSGTVLVGGTLDAGAAKIGNGGFVETSGSRVVIAGSATINTLAPNGKTGLWLLDPVNYTIASSGGDETPASVSASLATSNRLITASNDITVANAITLATAQTLTLNAGHDVLINAPITAAPAGAGLVLIAGNNVNVGAALTVTGASSLISISAANDVTISAQLMAVGATSPITIKAGHDVVANSPITAIAAGSIISLDAGRNVNVNAAISTSAAASSINLIAGLDGASGSTGSARSTKEILMLAGGTVTLAASASVSSISTTIRFNPVNYSNTTTEIAAYTAKVQGAVDAKAWLFARANNKTYNGTNAAILSFVGVPSAGGDVKMIPGAATFDNKDAGIGKTVIFSGATIGGADAGKFALFASSGTTTANISPAALTVTAANATKTYGESITLTGFTVAGLLNGDTVGSFTETSPGTAANASVTDSPYLITPSIASGGTFNASNYNIVYVNGALTVTPPLIAMSVSSAPARADSLISTVVLPENQTELQSVTPNMTPPVASPKNPSKI